MKHVVLTPHSRDDITKIPVLLQGVDERFARPRYTYMVLDLISTIARGDGRALPYVEDEGMLVPIRKWFSIAIAPTASHHHRRLAMSEQFSTSLAELRLVSGQDDVAREQVEAEMRSRIRISGMTAFSRAVSELVKAGLVKRHYQGFRVDHENRGRSGWRSIRWRHRSAMSGEQERRRLHRAAGARNGLRRTGTRQHLSPSSERSPSDLRHASNLGDREARYPPK